jgi:phenylpropionate dioxygenase-like ring-hydroxylating dioxygenase large terminal subunit
VISVVGDSVDWITFLPLSPDRVHAFGGFVFPTWAIDPEELERLRTTQAKTSEQINEEDRASVERLQQVVGSRLAAPGPLNVREGALGAFARYLARRLAAGPTAG